MFRNMASSNFPHSLNPSQVPAARHGNLITNNLVVSDEAVPFAACWKAERCRSIGHPLKQLFSLWRSGIKLRSIASLVFASNPLGEAGSWLIGAL
jgi:hypothetical protein